MRFNYKFAGSSSVTDGSAGTAMRFAPDTLRQPTYFTGKLSQKIPFREAISALNAVVVSDLRFAPKDKTAYREWLETQEELMLGEHIASLVGDKELLEAKINTLRTGIDGIRKEESKLMNVYWEAQNRYRQYVWKNDPDMSWVLDPVITVHPDALFFECFSKDESTYGKLTCNYEVFKEIDAFRCGTTNVDYSTKLYNEFQKIRTYKETELKVDPSGFEVQTAEDEAWKEVKIDLPDTWVRGFLQVSSAMTMPAVRFDLHPTDVYNICLKLRRHKETEGPRSLRWILKPGEPVRLVFEPWNLELVCPRSIFKGIKNFDIRLWGRRRLLMLERLIPVAQGCTVTLLGSGMPSFFEVHLGDMSFTLGLSGWTANDWSRAGNFDLLAPRAEVDSLTKQRVFDALRDTWLESTGSLAQRLDLGRDTVAGALSAYVQAGRVIYDLSKQVWRVRELSRDPLSPEALRFANPREAAASQLVEAGLVSETNVEPAGKGMKITALVQDKKRSHRPELQIDGDERLVRAVCDCSFHQANQLRQGPCEHILAARMAANLRL
ncbi:MAG: SWIM zinc finger family protein [Saprospiraceae bacterium]